MPRSFSDCLEVWYEGKTYEEARVVRKWATGGGESAVEPVSPTGLQQTHFDLDTGTANSY